MTETVAAPARGVGAGLRPAPSPRRRARREAWPYAFVLPMLAVLGFVFVYPLVTVVRNSFFAGSLTNLSYVGLGNYGALFRDPTFVKSLTNSLRLLLTVPVTTVVALLIALMLYEGTRAWKAYRLLVFVPYIVPTAAAGLAFSYLLQENGILNSLLRGAGLGFLALDWLGNPSLAIYSVGGVIVWSQLGFGVVVFTAALLSLPAEVSEAAVVDGATRWQRNRLVIVPQIRGTVEFFAVLQAIQVIAWAFPYVYVITHGGPGNASSVMDLYVWQYAFQFGSAGVSSAAAVVLLAIASVLIVIYSRLRARQGDL